jgi:hypothetical protein
VGRARALSPLLPSRSLNFLHMSEIVDADRELDQMQDHGRRLIAWLDRHSIGLFETIHGLSTVPAQLGR